MNDDIAGENELVIGWKGTMRFRTGIDLTGATVSVLVRHPDTDGNPTTVSSGVTIADDEDGEPTVISWAVTAPNFPVEGAYTVTPRAVWAGGNDLKSPRFVPIVVKAL